MLFARQRDLPFTELNPSIRSKPPTAAGPHGHIVGQDGVGRPRIMKLDTATRRKVAGRTAAGSTAAGSGVIPSAGVAVIAGPAPGAQFARKRIEHAIELFGACMFIAFALALALFA